MPGGRRCLAPRRPQAAAYLQVAETVIAKLGSAAARSKPFPKIVFEN